jgi:8-amino-7-oxononanoate synthase
LTHALGVFGSKGEGFVQMLNCKTLIYARILTFENGLDVSGAAVLGSIWIVDEFDQVFYTTGFRPCRF